MNNLITTYQAQIIAGLGAVILLTVGRAKLLPKVGGSKLALWAAFVVTVVCGLMLGWALHDVMLWLTGLRGPAVVVGQLGAIIAMLLGWHAVAMLVALIRDLADGRPDREARSAALWVPTFVPAGWAAVIGLISNPRSLGSGIVSAILAGITIGYCIRIVKTALQGRTGAVAWRWFAAGVCLLAGVVMIPLIAYMDATLAGWVSPATMTIIRAAGGVTGAALFVAAIADIADRRPDQHVRNALMYGMPLLFLLGSWAVSAISGGAGNGLELLTGTVQ
jgi:hypothetical protein